MSTHSKKQSNSSRRRPGFAYDMPEDCKKCYFWTSENYRCSLGGLDNCYYRVAPPKKEKDPCDGCPFGMHRRCIGYCTVQVIDYFKKRKEEKFHG